MTFSLNTQSFQMCSVPPTQTYTLLTFTVRFYSSKNAFLESIMRFYFVTTL